MASASGSLEGLPLEQLSLYHAVDPLLQSSIFVFHGPVTTANSTVSSSRIQAHIVSLAGAQSYPRITVSPAAPLYAAVNHLPREKQGDGTYRGLAVALLKYFSELPDTVKDGLTIHSRTGKQGAKGSTRAMFDELHAAEVANRLVWVEDKSVAMEVTRDLKYAFGDRIVPWIDIDLVLPAGTIASSASQDATCDSANYDPESPKKFSDRFGAYSSLIDTLGEPIFLPTSKLKRAPSQPTNLSKSKIFSAAQKESLRLSMCEVVDTEERFVGKMYDLVHNVAQQFRQKAVDRPATSTSPNETELARLFPPCLNEILDVNMGFLNAIRQILEDTEQAALGDISNDTTLDSSAFPRDPTTGRRQDSMGIIAFAQCLLDWFPRFSQPYAEYMHAHTSFSKVLTKFLGEQNSSFSKRVQETGEQRMRSLLMEPIQRLPRYSLLIDAMTGSLPSVHPAVRPLLRARDTITEICSLDSLSPNNQSQSLQRLQRLIAEWPTSVAPKGRLITTADFYTLPPPHRINSTESRAGSGIIMVYPDYLILLSKLPESKATARGLSADLDKPQPVDPGGNFAPDLQFSNAIPISSIRTTQSRCGRVLYLLPADNFLRNERSRLGTPLHAIELASTYEGKAGRLIEEIIKARIEGRFPEHYRERGKWSLHNPGGNLGDTKTLVSVFEDDASAMGIPMAPSTVKVVFEGSKTCLSRESSSSGVEVTISVSLASPGRYKLDLGSVVGVNSTETFAAPDFVSVLSKRLQNLLRPLHQTQNPLITDSIILSNFSILRVVAEQILGPAKASRSFRPPSPTKFLSSILGGVQPKDGKSLPAAPALGNVPNIPPPNSQKEAFPTMTYGKLSSPPVPGINITDDAMDQLKQAEQIFTAYVLAIQSRKGNIVGRVLRSRDRADPAAVNELYNVLLENPGMIQAAAEVPVDVLIVSFETFMRESWRETMGPLIPAHSLELIQIKFDSMFPGDFEDFFRRFLSEMSPQTRRALTSLIKLLAELLDASGNDGDRGALTAVFSEILTAEGDTRQHISLIDRLVEDFDTLFDDNAVDYAPLEGTLLNDPANTLTRPRSQTATGSVNSNTSSFRKRFGFGLSRERSKTESEGKVSEGKVSSIIRSLSKTKGSSTESNMHNTLNLPKDSSLLRSKSTDVDSRLPHTLRPTSRDRPLIQTLFSSVEELARPSSSHSNASSHASHVSTGERKGISPRKKRRSSLSDLPPLSASDVTPLFSTAELRRPITPMTNSTDSRSNSRPGTASDRSSQSGRLAPSIDFNRQSPSRTPPPAISPPTLRHTASTRKENAPFTSPRAVNRRSNVPSALPHVARKRGDSVSQFPSKSLGLRDRNVLPNGPEPLVSRTNSVTPATSTSPTKTMKLRMQNPQKLRERIQNEKKALASAELALQAELASIENELSNSRASPMKGRPSSSGTNMRFAGSSSMSSSSSTSTSTLLNRIRNLESKVTTLTSTLNSRTTSLEKDIEDSLLVSERRARRLDELYREASAENEALYERFNTELSRVTREIRAGGGEEILRAQLKEAYDEVTRVKKENLRLKREISGLKAQQLPGRENGHFTGANGH